MIGSEKKKEKHITSPEAVQQVREDPPPSRHASALGSGLHFVGDITGSDDLMIEGTFKGKIDIPDNIVKISSRAKIDGELFAKNIQIMGKVNGNIHASGKVDIRNTANVKGNIFAPRITIEEGAQFKGSIKMSMPR